MCACAFVCVSVKVKGEIFVTICALLQYIDIDWQKWGDQKG
jgi:hypothetical protein